MKFKLREEMYLSDQARIDYLKQAKKSKQNCDYEEISDDDIFETNDLIVAGRCGKFVWFYEFWTPSCWEGLYMKEEYKGLDEKEAIDKFMTERFPTLAKAINGEIYNWDYNESDIYDGGRLTVIIHI